MVVSGEDDQNPYAPIFQGDERAVQLVVINGTPRYGTPALMATDGPHLEKLRIGGEQRILYLKQDTEDPDVSALTYRHAHAELSDALHNIKQLRLDQEAKHAPKALAAAAPPISSILSPIKLDALTVADDHTFLDRVEKQINLPDYLASGLRELYSS